MMTMSLHIAVGVILGILVCVYGQSTEDVYRLHQDLLIHSNYSKHIRPAVVQTEPTIVYIKFDLVSIRELDAILGKLSIVGILYYEWVEPRMMWNPADYGMALNTKIEMRQVWKPDLIIAHPIESVTSVGFDHYHYPVRYFANGEAKWSPGDVMTTTCKINVAYYPFDTQTCEVMFIPWGMTIDEMFLNASQKEISTKYFVGHGEWELTKAYAREGLIDEMFPTYNVVLELTRRPTFIIVNVVMPILFMGLLNVLVFFLPAQSGERVSFSMTVLLAIAVFLTLVGDNMPKTSEPMSTICYFLLTNLVMSSVIMIITILNLNIFYKSDLRPVPTWLTKLVLVLTCKRTRRTKVREVSVLPNDDIPELGMQKGKGKCSVEEKWATPVADDENMITWVDVSRVLDKIFGVLAVFWLIVSAICFFVMVSTQSVPGVK